LKVHKPYIDAITYQSPFHPDGRMFRVSKSSIVGMTAARCRLRNGDIRIEGRLNLRINFPPPLLVKHRPTRGWFYSLVATAHVVWRNQSGLWNNGFVPSSV
jgi:isoleucyl-tRNA synthetase